MKHTCAHFRYITTLAAIAFSLFGAVATVRAQACPVSPTIAQSQPRTQPKLLFFKPQKAGIVFQPSKQSSLMQPRPAFLPRWSAEDLPFFCKIEHDWAKNRARIPVKFRLGSVEYVDWLEGKGL